MTSSTRRTLERAGERIIEGRTVFLLLSAVTVLVRIPFLRAFDLVTYDGTYYINQAKAMLGLTVSGGAFPIGYPLAIALFHPLVGDGVRAAQVVSFLAGIGSVLIAFALGTRMVSRGVAFAAALALAVTPLFIRVSTTTYSESMFVFWVLLSLYSFSRGWALGSGLSMGMAAMTRPEALGIFGVLVILMLLRRTTRRKLVMVSGGFLVLYGINVVVLSMTLDRLVLGDTRFSLVRRTELAGRTSTSWQGREVWADFEGRESYDQELEERGANVLVDGVKRFPGALGLLGRHAMPVAVILALYGVYRRRHFLLAGFVPLLFYPMFSSRNEPRYMLLYVPLVLLYAAVGLERIKRGWRRLIGSALLIASAAAGVVVNRQQLVEPVSDGFQWAKKAGTEWRDRLDTDDRVADRKPYFAFYAEAVYETIPIAPYEDAMQYLVEADARVLVLHDPTIQALRPALLPLLRDRAAVRGELRFRQAEADSGVYMIYESTGAPDPLERRRLTPSSSGFAVMPSWSPDGEWIAYRALRAKEGGGVFLVAADGGELRRITEGSGINDPLAWSPDSRQIALAVEFDNGNTDIAIIDVTGSMIRRVTKAEAADRSPSWSGDGREIVFCSNRTGRDEIWSVDIATGAETRITTDGGNTYPALSPSGDRIAWVSDRDGLVILDRASGQRTTADLGKAVRFVPSWSPDETVVAVTAEGTGGSLQVYLVTSAGDTTLRLTKSTAGNGMPDWSPDGTQLVAVRNEGGGYGLWVFSGLGSYVERLYSEYPIVTFDVDG